MSPTRARGAELSRLVQQEIRSIDGLSTSAQNVRVSSSGGQVTLTGPVRSQSEIDDILRRARSVHGVTHVVNRMTLEPQ